MHVSRVSRARIGLAFFLTAALTATLLARTTGIPVGQAMEQPAPQFLSWSGEPFSDDLNHYLVAVEPAATEPSDHWLEFVDNERLVATATPNDDEKNLAIADLKAAVAPRTGSEIADTPQLVAAHEEVTEVRSIGFGIYAVAGTITQQELGSIRGVAEVSLDSALHSTTVDPYYPSQWSLENDGATSNPWAVRADADIDAPEAWHRTRGDGVVVAVIDSGVDTTHPDLARNIWINADEQCDNSVDDDGNGYVDDCLGWDFANSDSSVDDLVGHGTHVAGIIAAQADNGIGISGVAYEAQIMALKIGDGTPALSAAIEAISYAIDNGARIVNASWLIDDPDAPLFLDAALTAAEAAGVLVVTGAGNEPIDIDDESIYPATSPHTNIITVGASTATDQPAPFSGFGRQSVDLFAPGEHIVSTIPGGYGVYSGSSMAAPMVSGAAALLWAATPQASYTEVKGALLDRSDGPNDGVTAFRGLAASDGRLNIDRSIYTRLFQPSLMYTFYDFNSFEPDAPHTVSVTAKTVDPWIVPPQISAQYRLGLYVPVDGQPMAVAGHEITYSNENGSSTSTTDETGRALVGEILERQWVSAFVQGGDLTTLTMSLPTGTYAVVMEVVDVTDPASPQGMGEPSAVFFIVNPDGTIAPMPELPIGDDPGPSTTLPPQPTPTTLPSTSTTVTSAAPSTTTSLTPQPGPAVTTTSPSQPTPTTTTAGPLAVSTTQAPATATTTSTLPITTTTVAPAPTTTTIGAPGGGPTTTTTTTTTTPTTPDDPSEIQISSINPEQGPTAGGTLVTITGKNLPDAAQVSFADRQAEIVSISAPTFLIVDTPPGAAGAVDVTVTDTSTGATAVYPKGFRYMGPDTDPTTPTTLPATTTTTTTLFLPTTAPSTTASPATSTTAPPPPPVTPSGGSLDDWLDSVLLTPDGLTLAPPAADDPILRLATSVWAGALCDQPVCPGWVLEQ